MAANVKSVLRLMKLYAKMDWACMTQDWTTMLIFVLSELLQNLSGMAGVLLLAARFGGVGGLSADEVLFMLGFFELAHGLTYMLFGGFNVLHISRRIGRGQIDHMLIQPRPLWMQLLCEGFMPASGCCGFLLGLILTVIAVSRLEVAITPLWFGLLVYYLLAHMALRLSQAALYGAAAFWQPVACEELSTVIDDLNNQLGRFPLFGLPTWLTAVLHSILPVGLLAYFPALTLLRRLGHGVEITLPFVAAALFVTAAVICFQKGLRHYEIYSCNRYKEMGHRC